MDRSSSLGLEQKRIEAAAVIDGLEGVRRHPQLDRTAKLVRDHRDVQQIGQEPPLGLAVGVAHLVPDLRGLPVKSHRRDMGRPLGTTSWDNSKRIRDSLRPTPAHPRHQYRITHDFRKRPDHNQRGGSSSCASIAPQAGQALNRAVGPRGAPARPIALIGSRCHGKG